MKPHDFVNILVSGHKNKHLNLEIQNDVHKKVIYEHPVPGFSPQDKVLKAISDNGDLFFESKDGKTFIINERGGTLIMVDKSLDDVIECIPEIMKDVFS